jgi:hypothetical protein
MTILKKILFFFCSVARAEFEWANPVLIAPKVEKIIIIRRRKRILLDIFLFLKICYFLFVEERRGGLCAPFGRNQRLL